MRKMRRFSGTALRKERDNMERKKVLGKIGAFIVLCLAFVLFVPGIFVQVAEASEIGYELTFTPGTGLPEELDKGNTDYAYLDMEGYTNGEAKRELYRALEAVANSFWGNTEELAVVEGESYALLATVHTADLGLTNDELFEVYLMFKNDHPVYYFLSNTVSITEADLLVMTDVWNSWDRAVMESSLGGYLVNYASYVDATSEYNTAKAIHDALVNAMSYSYEEDGVTPEDEYWAHSIEGAIRREQGVCEAYAKTYQMLLNYYEIDNVYVTGVAGGDNHAWNMVRLDDGLYYYVDATWNDTAATEKYFACGADAMVNTHAINKPSGSAGEFLYTLPEVPEENYVKKVAVYENGELLGKYASFERAFQKVADEESEYIFEIIGASNERYILPEGEWPKAKLLEFSYMGNDPSSEYYTVISIVFTGDVYLNCDVKFDNMSLDCDLDDYLVNGVPTLYARDYTIYLSGKGNYLGASSVIVSPEEVYQMGLRIEGPEATLVSDATDRFEMYESDVTLGTVYMNSWFLIRGGTFICDTLNFSESADRLTLSSFYNAEIALDIETMTVKNEYFDIMSEYPNDNNRYRIGTLNQECKNDSYVTLWSFIGTGKKIPTEITVEKFDRLRYIINYRDTSDYTLEELDRLIEEAYEAGDNIYNFYYDLYWHMVQMERYPSESSENIMTYQGKLLKIDASCFSNLQVSYQINKEYLKNESYSVEDFLQVDSEGNVSRAKDEAVLIENGVLKKARFFNRNDVTFVIPDTVTEIVAENGSRVFLGISNLVISKNVERMDEYYFGYAEFANITVVEENAYYASKDGILYNKDFTRLIRCPSRKTGTVVVPDSVVSLVGSAFHSSSLKKLILPASVEYIYGYPFMGASFEVLEVNSLRVDQDTFWSAKCKEIVLGTGVNYVDSRLLAHMTSIEAIHILNPTVEIVSDAFADIEVDSITVYGYAGSTAEEYVATYGEEYGLVFSALPNPSDLIEAFVTRMYRIILEREPDAGSATWIDGLMRGTFSGVRVADGFVMSDEFMNKDISNEAFVQILYRAFFDREADPEGLATWTGLLDAGCKKTYVFAGFANSIEFGDLCAEAGIIQGRAAEYLADRQTGLSEADYKVWCFVERMYMEVLNRTADEPGVRSWVGALQDGSMTGVQVADGFIMSEEFLAKNMTNEEYVRIMYRAFFGRDADPEGLATWTNALATGWTKQDVFAGFANSNEFGVLCGQAGIVQGTAEGK